MSTQSLLDYAGIHGEQYHRIGRQRRLERVQLAEGVTIRDQKPLSTRALSACLVGMDPAGWYALLNTYVFFWFDIGRLNRQRSACRGIPQVVLIVDSARLLVAYGSCAVVTPINTGNTRRRAARRGEATFVPYAAWLTSRWNSEVTALRHCPRRANHKPVELAIPDAVPDIMNFVCETRYLAADEHFAAV